MRVGRLAYLLVGSRRRVALRNLDIGFPDFPERERGRIAGLHFGYLGVAAITQGRVSGASRSSNARLETIRHRERFDRLHAEGHNLIVMVAHFVGLELGGAAFTALIQPGNSGTDQDDAGSVFPGPSAIQDATTGGTAGVSVETAT